MSSHGSIDGNDDVRDKYLELLQEMKISKEEALDDKVRLEELVDASNMLFKRIKTTSELKLDAKVTAMSTRLKFSRMEKDIHADAITSGKLIELFENDLLDGFYEYAASCSLGIQFVESLSFHQEEDKIRARSRKTRFEVSGVKVPKVVSKTDDLGNDSELLLQIKDLLEKKDKIEYFRLVIDPTSFAKTIENIFYLSLATQSGIASLESYDDVLYVRGFESHASREPSGHFVLDICHDEYLEIIRRLGITKCMLDR